MSVLHFYRLELVPVDDQGDQKYDVDLTVKYSEEIYNRVNQLNADLAGGQILNIEKNQWAIEALFKYNHWWIEQEEVLRQVSKEYPDVRFDFYDESDGTFGLSYYFRGRALFVEGQIEYPEFDLLFAHPSEGNTDE